MMKRFSVGILVLLLATGLSTASAEGAKKKGGAAKGKKAAAAAPNSAQIAESLGDVHWGMSKDELMQKLIDKVKEMYRPLLGKTKDAVKEDQLRQKAREEMEAIRKGYYEFNGRSSNWDVSFLKGEYTQGNDEAMLAAKDQNSQNYYFFIGGKLWKWYKAFDASVFPVDNFAAFAGAVQRKFGPAKEAQGELRPGEPARHWLEWQDKTSRLKAIDQTDFYGFYSLVFEEKATTDNLARLRSHTDSGGGEKHHAMVDSVTSGDTANPDDAPNIVDRLTGHTRQIEQAPQQQDEQASAGKASKSAKGKDKGASSSAPVASEDDPISGLGL